MTRSNSVALPSSFGRRASPAIAPFIGVLVMVGVAFALDPMDPNLFYSAGLLIWGIGTVIRAWVIRREPALVLDGDGIRSRKGELLLRWSDAALIWIGRPSSVGAWIFGPATLHVYTGAGLSFARRTGFVPDPRLVVSIETTLPAEDIEPLFRQHTGAVLQTGTRKELEHLITAVRSNTDDLRSEPTARDEGAATEGSARRAGDHEST